MSKAAQKMPPKPRRVCVVSDYSARSFAQVGIGYRCSGGRHVHYSRAQVLKLIASGNAMWVGQHNRVAKFVNGRQWRKTISRDGYSSMAVMQLVVGG